MSCRLRAVELDDPAVLADALGHVLVGRQDHDPLDRRVVGPARGGRAQRVVGLPLDHRPDDDARAPAARPRPARTGRAARADAGAGLVARPALVAPRLDDVVGGAAEVGDAVLAEQLERRSRRRRPSRSTGLPVGSQRAAAAARSGRGTARRSRRAGGPASVGQSARPAPAGSSASVGRRPRRRPSDGRAALASRSSAAQRRADDPGRVAGTARHDRRRGSRAASRYLSIDLADAAAEDDQVRPEVELEPRQVLVELRAPSLPAQPAPLARRAADAASRRPCR